MKTPIIGRYIVADPETCQGKPTFRGTLILVGDVLEQVATGMVWESIIEQRKGYITKEAIAEALRLARQALLEHLDEYRPILNPHTSGVAAPTPGDNGKNGMVVGRYVVADPEICHGKLTFRGTRIFAADVLDQVARGMIWESIIRQWRGSIRKEAIAEAIRLARRAFLEHAEEYRIELRPVPEL
ncbi:MAG: DUF433 domain-containing protein, partial [Chloroflexota bacterium]